MGVALLDKVVEHTPTVTRAYVDAGFTGTLGVRIQLAPPRDPESKGLVERRNGFFETSFLPGRVFTSPFDFNIQISQWLAERANVRHLRAIGARPVDRWPAERAAMVALPPMPPQVGLTGRVRLGRDYYIRVEANDYSVDPRAIGRFVDWIATPARVVASCAGQVVADHGQSWTSGVTITDPRHRATARLLRAELAERRAAQRRATRSHPDGHVVALRALPDYDALYGVDFDPRCDEQADAGSTKTEGISMATTTASTRGSTPAVHRPRPDHLDSKLAYLTRVSKTPTIGRVWQDLADTARDANWSHEEYLTAVLERQVADRESAGNMMRIRTAHFPAIKTLEDFNLEHLPILRKDVLAHLATATFVPKWSAS